MVESCSFFVMQSASRCAKARPRWFPGLLDTPAPGRTHKRTAVRRHCSRRIVMARDVRRGTGGGKGLVREASGWKRRDADDPLRCELRKLVAQVRDGELLLVVEAERIVQDDAELLRSGEVRPSVLDVVDVA